MKALYANVPDANNEASIMIERRAFRVSEIRVEQGEKRTITGHAAVFNSKSEEIFGVKGVREVIRAGAFAKSISRGDDIRALWNHDPNFILGRSKNHTLEISEDDIGLKVRIFPPDSTLADGFLETIRRGDVDQMSFGFRTVSDAWQQQGGETIRELLEVDLFDVSPVTFPAYKQTDVAVRDFILSKLTELAAKQGEDPAKVKFIQRQKERDDFLSRRETPGNPNSMEEIIKRAKIKGE
jgi:Escherichia/Staphylococcus phage prohead protease